jgi:large subunit ribosomal protein L15
MRLIRRLPKRGFTSVTPDRYVAVNLESLSRFADGTEVTPEVLREAGLVKGRGRVKILGSGQFGRKLVVKAQAFSAGAREKIEGAGGRCEIVGTTAH